jgi:hypothetical protein
MARGRLLPVYPFAPHPFLRRARPSVKNLASALADTRRCELTTGDRVFFGEKQAMLSCLTTRADLDN